MAAKWGHPEVAAQTQRSLNDAAAVNASHWALYHRLAATGLPLATGAGGRTTWPRTTCVLPTTHRLDAACIGASTPEYRVAHGVEPLLIMATGRHSRQLCGADAFGFPGTGAKAIGVVGGLRTGDLLRAVVTAPSVKARTSVGRLAVRVMGRCNITTQVGVAQGIPSANRSSRPLRAATGTAKRKERQRCLRLPEGRGIHAAYVMSQQHRSPDGVTIIQVDVEEVELVAPLFDAYRQFYGQAPDLDGATDFLTERLGNNESVVFLALAGSVELQTPVGFTQLYPLFSSTRMRPIWLLNDLFVAPTARRAGVGRALLQHARLFAEESGAAGMMLETAVDNAAAQALYQSLGWVRETQFYTYNLALPSA
jgi:ribosomal protein S18 acetylase RimI-like enzyme